MPRWITCRVRELSVSIALLASADVLGQAGSGCDPCETEVPPGLIVNETWTVDGSPYCVLGDIDVSLLTIEAGVVVCVAPDAEINVLSTIQAIGTAEAPITFTAQDPENPWHGIRFEQTPPGSELVHCTIEWSETSGIRLINADPPRIEGCVIRSNSGGTGGGLNAVGLTGELEILGSRFCQNTAAQHGGGMRVQMEESGTLTIRDSAFDSNTSNPTHATGNFVGGALYLSGGTCQISQSRFLANRSNSRCVNTFDCSVTARGGAIYIDDAATVSMNLCEILSNQTDARNNGNCFFGGSSRSYGAGAYVQSGSLSLTNCIASCNSTTRTNCGPSVGGGGVYVNGGSVSIVNSTVARNTTATGLAQAGGSLEVDSSIIYFNNGGGTQVGGAAMITYSDVQGEYEGEGNIDINPVFAGDDCGCPDYRIVLGSQCVDAGNPNLSDADCDPRPSLGGLANDMGAHGGPGSCGWDCWLPGDVNCDRIVDVRDLLDILRDWGTCPAEPCESCEIDIDCSGAVDFGDVVKLLRDWS